jgi:hypothetical protein
MVSWFPTVTEEEILAVYTAAVLSNTKKTTKFSLAVFTKYGFIIFSREVIGENRPKTNCLHI